MKNGFFRGHGLGNDYVVMDPLNSASTLRPGKIRGICDRHWGLGSDGIPALVPSKKADFGLRIYNRMAAKPKKSGNGSVSSPAICTPPAKRKSGRSRSKQRRSGFDHLACRSPWDAAAATVEMGQATFQPSAPSCTLSVNELIQGRPSRAAGRSQFTGVSVGNPHCVVFKEAGQSLDA